MKYLGNDNVNVTKYNVMRKIKELMTLVKESKVNRESVEIYGSKPKDVAVWLQGVKKEKVARENSRMFIEMIAGVNPALESVAPNVLCFTTP